MNRHSVTVVTPPAAEPVTLAEAKAWLRIDGTAEDTIITSLISEAREIAETYTRRAFITRTLKLTLDAWPRRAGQEPWWDGVREMALSELSQATIATAVPLPFAPLNEITSVKTFDSDDTESVMSPADYQEDTAGSRLCLKRNASWPSNLRPHAGIEIEYIAGYGEAGSNVPFTLRRAILIIAAALYHNRECGDMPDDAVRILRPYIAITDGRLGV